MPDASDFLDLPMVRIVMVVLLIAVTMVLVHVGLTLNDMSLPAGTFAAGALSGLVGVRTACRVGQSRS